MEVTLIDSPVANVANIARALRAAGANLHVTRDPDAIATARKLVLPGVGTFTAAMRWLEETHIDAAIREAVTSGGALLGICVGHQLLFDVSYEMGVTRGMGLIHGEVKQYKGTLPVPQIGWNCVTNPSDAANPRSTGSRSTGSRSTGSQPVNPRSTGSQPVVDTDRLRVGAPYEPARAFDSLLFDGIPSGTAFYFVNSFAVSSAACEIARADYGGPFTAAVESGRVFGVQFHPEKSSTAGLRVLRNYVEKVR